MMTNETPVYNDIELVIEHVRVDGELWWDENDIFRQDPTPETDQARKDLIGGEANRIFVCKEDWIKTGLDPDVGAQWVGDPTGQTYMAEINVFHLIHCLHMIRRGAFMDYYEFARPINPLFDVGDYGRNDMDGLPRVKPNPLRSKYGP
ncbi:hypothetical protein CKM354_000914600 [Cercospora kikuchii]|uniref:Uncharacterized protein n=1 Tax=Cercospora kikuchii TaxID=84275 RepID=A0A9P3CX35_9PEZI|nr:uncharacterized protein CKM354_000914600 [Cercospora kikuchii]GIZ46003.1 hypothetical protein CKM354_000914600 [Cercospora kikuchii]